MSVLWQVKREEVNEQLASDIDDVLGKSAYSWAVYRGHASTEQQALLYKKYKAGGPLAAPPYHSAHEAVGPTGLAASLAVDVARLTGNGQEVWDYDRHPAWQWLWDVVRLHPRMHSGHEFPNDTAGRAPADDDHIQYQALWNKYKTVLRSEGKW